jgi:hypothetical protein
MQEACFCGRSGEVAKREPVYSAGGERALRCPDSGHTDDLRWLLDDARLQIFGEAECRRLSAA